MSSYDLNENRPPDQEIAERSEVVVAELVSGPPNEALPVARLAQRRLWLPVGLFVATCLSTLFAGTLMAESGQGLLHMLNGGLMYAVPLMTILICHEAGHFLQARRYGVYTSYPYFIPMPLGFIGTFGAVIAMDPRIANRRALFDIGISGPLAGLVPTLVFCVLGLQWSEIKPGHDLFGDPILFKQIAIWLKGPIPEGYAIYTHPVAFAGWVGLLITSINLLPIGQLDGGHVLYGLLRTKAHRVAWLFLLAAAGAVLYQSMQTGRPSPWFLMLLLLTLMGPIHPPTANDHVPLGAGRIALGWATLAFFPLGFTPTPIIFGS